MTFTPSSYNTDAVAWSDEQAELLRQKNWNALDLENIAEEIEDLGRKYRDALRSHMARLMHHLKQQYQPLLATRRWDLSIREASTQIRRLLRDHPSLKQTLKDSLGTCYQDAREDVADETGLEFKTFPELFPAELQAEIEALI